MEIELADDKLDQRAVLNVGEPDAKKRMRSFSRRRGRS
jgi:hypothetical protein